MITMYEILSSEKVGNREKKNVSNKKETFHFFFLQKYGLVIVLNTIN